MIFLGAETSVPRSYVKAGTSVPRLDRDAETPLSRNRMTISYVINEHVCGVSVADYITDLIICIRHLANVITLPRVIK